VQGEKQHVFVGEMAECSGFFNYQYEVEQKLKDNG